MIDPDGKEAITDYFKGTSILLIPIAATASTLLNTVNSITKTIGETVQKRFSEKHSKGEEKVKKDSRVGEKWKGKQKNPGDWELTDEKIEPGNKKGQISIEREYSNKKTGEKLYEHEIRSGSGKIVHGPHPRGYGK